MGSKISQHHLITHTDSTSHMKAEDNILKFTIITVCMNSAKHIEKCVNSVTEQNYPHIEYIIIDGASTDGTIDIIKKHQKNIDHFISEPDDGLYQAMNKGIDLSTGDILFFLNSDDYFYDKNVVSDVEKYFHKNPKLNLIYGDQTLDDGKKIFTVKQPNIIRKRRLARKTLHHQTIFARKLFFNDDLHFSEHYKVVSDYEWILKVFLNLKANYKHINRKISVMSMHGISSTYDYESERIEVMQKFFTKNEIFLYRSIQNFSRTTYHNIKKAITKR